MPVTMKTVIGILAVGALLFNSGYAVNKLQGGDSGGWMGGGGDGGGDSGEDMTVKVPPNKLYDLITYEYIVFAEMYWKNYTSGEWELYQLKINGQLKRAYSKLLDAHDGFWVTHKCVEFDTDTNAKFEIITDSSGGEPLTIPGSIDGKRKEYIEVNSKKVIDAQTNGDLTIDRLPKYDVPLSFKAYMDAYPNPNRVLEETVDQKLYGAGQSIRTGTNGSFVIDKYYDDWDYTMGTRYNWTAEAVQKISDVKSVRVNITMDMFGQETGNATVETWNYMNETVWISNDIPFPVKRYTLTNQTFWDTDDEGNVFESRIIFETTNTMIKNGFSGGSQDLPWGNTGDTVFNIRHPKGEYLDWQTAPPDGSGVEGSGMMFGINEAVAEARLNSSGVQNFYFKFDQPDRQVLIDGAYFNTTLDPTDVNGKAGTYRWNLTFGVNPTRNEYTEARNTDNWNFYYSIVIVKNVTKEIEKLRTVYKERIEIERDWGEIRGYSAIKRERLKPDGCSQSSAADIMLLHPEVQSKATNSRTGNLDWKTCAFMVGGVGLGGAGPGFQMMETLTGITFPTADYAWAVQSQSVYQQGQTTGAAVDVETGQLVYVMDIQGTALLGIFG